ncbi:PTS system mannose/fructose/sorbose family transporter subunit IID [Alloiococcus otitis]|uniref:PTS system mannose/fructose/sorbose family transporter subunit IID n=1 Tax=Alloiococcus otitis TaxID=1652 RepID=UPI002357E803|nr:PTS system mannose/fructose/sorbose family transporter subunit IID [Alloiococcus otitis]
MTNSKETQNKLSKKDLKRISLRYLFGAQLGWNYERMMNVAYTNAISPAVRKLYDEDEDIKDILKTEMQFFNTSPFMNALILGMDLALQEKDGKDSKEAVAAVKTSLMGPFAAVGDSLFGSVLPAIFGALAAYMGLEGNPLGVIIWLIAAVAIAVMRYYQLPFAFRQGEKLLTNMQGLLSNLTEAATLLGVFVVGGLVPTVVNVEVPFELNIGEAVVDIQADMLDQILPALVPIALVALAYWLLGRDKLNSTKVIWIFLFLSIILYAVGFLDVMG